MVEPRDYDEDASFFEEDEPAGKIHAAYERGVKGITWPPGEMPPGVFHGVLVSENGGSVSVVIPGDLVSNSLSPMWVTDEQAGANTRKPVLAEAG